MIIATSFDQNQPENWFNRAMQYGDGVFETMRISAATIPLLSLHLSRLNQSLLRLDLNTFAATFLEHALQQVEDELLQSAVLKLVVFRANQKRTYRPLTKQIDWVISLNPLTESNQTETQKLGVAKQKLALHQRTAGLKHLSRIEQVLIANELNQRDDVDDLMVLDEKGRVIETTQHNLVCLKDHHIITPQLDYAGVHGVALSWLQQQMHVTSKNITTHELADFDAVMMCNSVRGFVTVEQIISDSHNLSISYNTCSDLQAKIKAHWQTLFSA